MILSMETCRLKRYIECQAEQFFPDDLKVSIPIPVFENALLRYEYNASKINLQEYSEGGQTYFNHLHSDQYAMLLYFISNEMYHKEFNQTKQGRNTCDKLMVLNRALSGAFIPYKTELPEIFFWAHPVGTVLGHAKYSDYLIVMQNVTVSSGTDYDNVKSNGKECPVFGKYLQLCSGAKIVGRPVIGDYVSIGVNAVCFGRDIPNDCTLYCDEETGATIINKRTKPSSSMLYFRE